MASFNNYIKLIDKFSTKVNNGFERFNTLVSQADKSISSVCNTPKVQKYIKQSVGGSSSVIQEIEGVLSCLSQKSKDTFNNIKIQVNEFSKKAQKDIGSISKSNKNTRKYVNSTKKSALNIKDKLHKAKEFKLSDWSSLVSNKGAKQVTKSTISKTNKAISSSKKAVSSTKMAASSTTEAVSSTKEAVDSTNNFIEAIKNHENANWANIISMAASTAATWTSVIANWASVASIWASVASKWASVTSTWLSVAADWASTAATWASTAANQAAAAAQWLFNAALSANPIGIVIMLVGGLILGLIALYKHSDKARAIMDKMWNGIKSGAEDSINGVIGILNFFIDHLNKIKLPKWLSKITGIKGFNIKKIEEVNFSKDKTKPVSDLPEKKYSDSAEIYNPMNMEAYNPMKNEKIPKDYGDKSLDIEKMMQNRDFPNDKLSDKKMQQIIQSSSSSNKSITKQNSFNIEKIIGQVNVTEEADEDRLISKIETKLKELMETGGEAALES